MNMPLKVSVYDTKPYDRDHLLRSEHADQIEWRFLEFRLTEETAQSATGSDVVCVFVNDKIDRACMTMLKNLGVRLIALRCAGFNNVDLQAAKELAIAVVRVPAYSPNAVAEHTVGLLLASIENFIVLTIVFANRTSLFAVWSALI